MRILAAVLALGLAAPLSAQNDRGRPLVLLVHGRGMLDRDTALTRKLWLDGLRSGASAITQKALFDDRDVRVVWYADVLDPASDAGCDYPDSDPRARRAARGDDGLKSVVSMAGGLFGALAKLVDDKETATQMRELAGDAAFLGDARKRCASEDRLGAALARANSEGRPVILVAHSLGSLVAYDYLTTRRDTGLVRELATLGSPLGSPDLRRLLIGGDESDTLSKLPSVMDWVNIRNDGDPFATSVPFAREIVAVPPTDEKDPHELVGYLREKDTAQAILSAWCKAFAKGAPSGCREVAR
jgi:pimeloyl-ACP methyl ester carboxylesterase